MKKEISETNIDRRFFLGLSGGTLLGFALPGPTRAAGVRGEGRKAGAPLFVCIFLRGGADALNILPPYGEKRYYELRPTIAVPPPEKGGAGGVIPLDGTFGLHPALAPLKPLYDDKRFAPIVDAGSPHPTRSHFEAQYFMDTAAPGNKGVRSGWLNRYLRLSRKPKAPLRALAPQGLLPRSLRGDYPVLAFPGRAGGRDLSRLLDRFAPLYGPPSRGEERDPVLASGWETIQSLRRYLAIQNKKVQAPPRPYPQGPLGPRLQAVAKIVAHGDPLEIACLDWGGWDTHTNEGGARGRLAGMLDHLGKSLAAFMEDLGPAAERALVLVQSEFGRTCKENGNGGTDHGHGGVMLLLGGPVRGGKVYGRWRGLEKNALYQGRDLPVTTDFRDVYAEILERHLGFPPPENFFPGYRPGKGPGILG